MKVLFVTTSPERVAHMVEACGALRDALPFELFRFTDRTTLLASKTLFERCWVDGRGAARELFSDR
jgi:hypothetical protein